MENLEIISTSITKSAKEVLNGNTISYHWNYEEGQQIIVVNFSLNRGVAGDPSFNGNTTITGAYYSENSKFDIQNNNFQEGDFILYQSILDNCQSITSLITEE